MPAWQDTILANLKPAINVRASFVQAAQKRMDVRRMICNGMQKHLR